MSNPDWRVQANEICEKVEELLPHFSGYSTALVIPLVAVARVPQGNVLRQNCYFLFARPMASTQVYWLNRGREGIRPGVRMEWLLKCQHDSAWREDGVRDALWELLLEMARKLEREGDLRSVTFSLLFPQLPAKVALKEFNDSGLDNPDKPPLVWIDIK